MKEVAVTARVTLTPTMEYCTLKMRLGSSQAVIDRLKGGDGQACGYCHPSVTKQVAESLGTLDENTNRRMVV